MGLTNASYNWHTKPRNANVVEEVKISVSVSKHMESGESDHHCLGNLQDKHGIHEKFVAQWIFWERQVVQV